MPPKCHFRSSKFWASFFVSREKRKHSRRKYLSNVDNYIKKVLRGKRFYLFMYFYLFDKLSKKIGKLIALLDLCAKRNNWSKIRYLKGERLFFSMPEGLPEKYGFALEARFARYLNNVTLFVFGL